MSEQVRVLFRELAGLPASDRQECYARRQVATAVQDELESLLSFDTAGGSLTKMVRGATEDFLLSDAPLSEERRCGPYRVIRLLGNGGMGAVYLAERADGEVEQQVAIKFLRSGRDEPFFRQRFLRERQILASLNHPGIARLIDAGHNAGHPYLVMEYVEGVAIDRFAETHSTREVIALFIQVAEAVSYAHRNLIIHRDLKPSNVMVDHSGRPKLLDFGIAKLLDVTAEETQTLERAMTPEYASPEQMHGGAQATTSDIYSLGAVLYRLLTGRSPRQFGQIAGEIPNDLACIIAKAMRQEPEERYGSVDLLIADLRAYLDFRPVQARRGNGLYHARKLARRHRIPVTACALALIGIAAGIWFANRERTVAEWRFQQVRQLSKQFLDLDTEVRALPGSTKARTRIVSASLQYLGRLAAPAHARWGRVTGHDADLALEIGEAYLKVARVQGVPVNSNLGQFAQAKESLDKADAFVESVVGVPDSRQRARALLLSAEIARDSTILADTIHRESDTLAFAHRAAVRLEALLATPGVTAEQSAAAAGLYSNIALTYCNLHHLEEATTYARRGVEIARTAGHDERQLGRLLGVLANTARFAGQLDEALAAIRDSRAIGEKLADPDNVESMLQLAGATWREGLILGELNNINLDRPREAEPLLQRALDIAEGLARKDPYDYTSRSYVSMAGRELGDVLRDGQPERALAVYDLALRRLAESKNNPKARRDEVWLQTGSSYALRRLGRVPEAGQRVQAALENLRKLKEYPASQVELGAEADAAFRALADHQAATGDTVAAIRTYRELYDKAMVSKPHPESDLRHANALSRIYRDLASLEQRAGNRTGAGRLRERRLELWRDWDRRLPANPFVTRQLADATRQAR